VRKIVLCTGKVYYDLAEHRAASGHDADTAIIRVERLYPLPAAELRAELDRYPADADLVWVQEEPANMGAWPTMALYLPGAVGRTVRCVSLPPSSAPAAGSAIAHRAGHQHVIETALEGGKQG
jgi:2-oxoglutarate dehydrogenase E1 component